VSVDGCLAGPRRAQWQRVRRIAVQVATVGLVLAGTWVLAHHLVRPLWHDWFDLKVYRGAVRWWAGGESLYSFHRDSATGSYGFTYPPVAAVVLSPLGLAGWRLWAWLMSAASLAIVVVTTWRFFGPVARRAGWPPVFAVALAVPVVLLMDPVRETIAFGQINLYLVALVLADVVAIRRGWRWAGAGTGIAAAIKLTPAIFLLYFALTCGRRPAAVGLASFAAATLTAFLISPHTSVQYWTSMLWDTSRVGHTDKTPNQSLLGLLTRVTASVPAHLLWVLLGCALLVFGLWRARRAYAEGDELVGLTVTGLTGVLVSPISWTHHLFWIVPAVIVLIDVAVGRPTVSLRSRPRQPSRWGRPGAGIAAVVITAVCCSSLIWYFQPDEGLIHTGGLLGALGENSFALAMLALVVLLPIRARVPAASEPTDDSDAVLAAG
jgi:alpha-1,2-mannosyltransferase